MQIEQIKQQLQEGNSLKGIIDIISYLPFAQKQILCNNIIESSLEQNENGLYVCDNFTRKLIMDISILVNYTEIELSKETLQDYDTLCELGIVEYVLDNINKNELKFIEEIVEKTVGQKIKIENSLESVLAKTLNKLVDKLPDEKSINKIINNIPKVINKIKPESLGTLKDFINQQQVQQKVE